MKIWQPDALKRDTNPIALCGARYAQDGAEIRRASILIEGGRIVSIGVRLPGQPQHRVIDLDGYLLLPGLINAHDHLQFALYPRLGRPPYRNYIEWGEDIHRRFADVIAQQHSIPLTARLWWGAIRNLLCGVTTVCHHDPLWPELVDEHFPIRVIRRFGWAHSLLLGGDLLRARANTPARAPFIVHACEGTDARALEELWLLDELGLLGDQTVLVHGLSIDADGVARIRERRASLIVCPSSNDFLYHKLPDISLLRQIPNLALGSDSPVSGVGDLLDEVGYAVRRCGVNPSTAFRMVTGAGAAILRLRDGEGSLREGGVADLIAVRDTGENTAERLANLSMHDVELVMIRGRVQLASERILERSPASLRHELEPLWADGVQRWLRAPVGNLLKTAEQVLGNVRLGGKSMRLPAPAEIANVQ